MTRDCFYPDGLKAPSSDGAYSPCTPDSASGSPSACCKTGDSCSRSGLCHGSSGFMYRGACTDPTWSAPECAQHCRNASVHNYSHLYPCPSTNGSFTHTFCCDPLDDASDDTSPGGGCCDNTFVVVDFGSVDPNRTSSSTPSSSSSPQSSNTPTAIGAGVGVPLGVLLLAGLAYSWYRERASRRRVRERGEEGRERGSEGGKVGREQGSESRKVEPGGESGAQVHELEQVGGWAELHGQARAEVGNRLSV